jgi:hypothetical protein
VKIKKTLIQLALAIFLLSTGVCCAESDEELTTNKALFDFVTDQARGSNSLSSGGSSAGTRFMQISVHMVRTDNDAVMETICAVVVDGVIDSDSRDAAEQGCTTSFLHMIAKISQPDRMSPYRAAGRNELEWWSRYASIASGDLVFVLTGRYRFPVGHRSCRLLNNCCDMEGSRFLQSCRTPSADENKAIDICAAEFPSPCSSQYKHCLQDRGIKIGCEDQDDGSRICY